jgi:hypothetical protein
MGVFQSKPNEACISYSTLNAFLKSPIDTFVIFDCPSSKDAARQLTGLRQLIENFRSQHVMLKFKIDDSELTEGTVSKPKLPDFNDFPLIVSFESSISGENVMYWKCPKENEVINRSCESEQESEEFRRDLVEQLKKCETKFVEILKFEIYTLHTS